MRVVMKFLVHNNIYSQRDYRKVGNKNAVNKSYTCEVTPRANLEPLKQTRQERRSKWGVRVIIKSIVTKGVQFKPDGGQGSVWIARLVALLIQIPIRRGATYNHMRIFEETRNQWMLRIRVAETYT